MSTQIDVGEKKDENLVLNEKGAVSRQSTSNLRLDLFFNTVRKIEEEHVVAMLEASWLEDPLDTLKIVFYIRDCRGGKGERAIFRTCIRWLISHHKEHVLANVSLVTEYGRWEDLLWFLDVDDEVRTVILQLFAKQLKEDLANMQEGKPVTICAKWAPTEKGKHDSKFRVVSLLCRELGIDKKTYRKAYLGPLREYLKVVELFMCSKRWTEIDYNKVPSLAMNKLKKAFAKNDPERFLEWQQKLKRGDADTKVNASVIDPHTLVNQYISASVEEDTVIEEQWKEILLRVSELGTMSKALVLSDVSGSMYGDPMVVSIALGILISTLTQPPFQNLVLTFESTPRFFNVVGKSLREQVTSLQAAPWGGSTDLGKAFDAILDLAKRNAIPQKDMPEMLFIISDMQFDVIEGYGKKTALDGIRQKYNKANYDMPKIVFWNVRASLNSTPAKSTDPDVALISGYSPSVMKSVLKGDVSDFTPYGIMRTAIDDERYEAIKLAKEE